MEINPWCPPIWTPRLCVVRRFHHRGGLPNRSGLFNRRILLTAIFDLSRLQFPADASRLVHSLVVHWQTITSCCLCPRNCVVVLIWEKKLGDAGIMTIKSHGGPQSYGNSRERRIVRGMPKGIIPSLHCLHGLLEGFIFRVCTVCSFVRAHFLPKVRDLLQICCPRCVLELKEAARRRHTWLISLNVSSAALKCENGGFVEVGDAGDAGVYHAVFFGTLVA
ncbi:uncharacterized protein LY89DRAFT_289336 [Mollisia scopiformis]|uniref:Uncharacterized protein n=1 Tax=Mollisia scopiformis TaxID=149040 RepID=A0A132BAR0_MOLSC|nr:uncharacterized protein LY89DRAFT_289336 [Mollisia scopiformis]KUJ09505.1 hypothetical protein LY89DRAFT_289336 [Mollisia scopiformis]